MCDVSGRGKEGSCDLLYIKEMVVDGKTERPLPTNNNLTPDRKQI